MHFWALRLDQNNFLHLKTTDIIIYFVNLIKCVCFVGFYKMHKVLKYRVYRYCLKIVIIAFELPSIVNCTVINKIIVLFWLA